MNRRIKVAFLGIMIGTNLFAFEKVGVTSFQFLKVIPDARSTAMGEAYTSIANGADGLYWNPAAMMRSHALSINISQVDYIFDTKHFGTSISYAFNQFALGFTFSGVDYGEIEVTDVNHLGFLPDGTYNPGVTGETIQPGAFVVGIGGAQRLTNKFTYGINMKYVQEDMEVAQKSLLMWDMGILFETGFRTITLSATIRNFGPQVEYFDYSYPLPQTMNIGISSYLIGGNSPLLLKNDLHKLLVAFDLVQPRDYDQQYNIGLEYTFRNIMILRAGYKINYDTEGLTLGTGLRLKGLGIDYSYCSYGKYLSAVHRFSLSFNREIFD